jgi:hypothetical protein
VTGFTDSYTTDAYLSGTEVRFDNSVEGVNYYNVDLNPLLSGKTDNTTFNTYTANTQTILDGKIDSVNNVGGANEFFKDKVGTAVNFRTLSGGSNTTVSTVGDVVKVDVTIPPATNTFVTGFTYNDTNTFTISRNDGVDLSTSINTMTGLTVNGSISATTYFGDGSNLTGISTDDNFVTGGTLNSGTLILERQNGTVIITGFTTDLDTYVTGGTVSISATDSDNSGTIGLFYKNSDGIPRTLPFKDTFVTGGTYDNGSSIIEFTKNDSTTFNVDLSSIDVNDTFSTGGTVTQSATSGSTDVTIQITGNQGFTPYNITGLTDTFVNDFSFSSNTFTISQNDGSTFEADVDTIDLSNILSGVTFDIATSGSISATTFNGGTFNGTFVGDGSGLTGITGNDTFVTGTTFSSNQAILSRNDGFEVFKFSGGSNVNLSNPSTNEIKIDVSLPSTMNTFVTGFTYNDANTFTITDNDGGVFNASINTVTGLTVNGDITVTETSNLNAVTATTIDFDLNYTGATSEGRLSWNSTDATLDLGMGGGNVTQQIGQEIYYRIKNQSGSTISNGRVVRNAGSVGASGRILGEYMIADGTYPFAKTLGIATEDILNGSDGLVTEFGVVRGLNTTGSLYGESWSDGDVLYVSSTIPGGLTNVEPQAPNQILEMGVVLFSNVSNGSIFVDRHLSTKLGDISDVQTTGSTNGDLIVYNSATTVWEYSKTLTGDYDINGSLSATTLDGNTILSGGTNLLTIIESLDTNTFVSGGTYNDTTNNINFSGNSTETTFDVDLTSLVSSVSGNTFVVGGTYVDSTDTLSLLRNDGDFVNITGITDTFTTGSTYDNGTALATFTRNDGNTYTLDLSTIDVNDTFVTGFTYNNANTFTISRNDGVDLNSSFNTVTGLTVNGSLNATTILSGGTNLTTVIESLDTYVTGGTVSVPATNNTNSGSIGLFYKNSDGTPRTLPFEDTYTTGSTYDNGTALATFDRNDGTNYTLDLSTIDVNDIFSTGGTVTQTSSINENNQTIQIVGNGGFTPYNITNVTDTFTTGGTYNNGTALITFDKNDGTTYDVDLSSLDLNDTFVTGTTFSSNQATVTRNDGTDVLLLTGGTKISLSNPSSNQIKIDVTPELNIVTVSTTTYTATTSDEIIGVDTSSNAVTITLPDSLSSGTLRYEIKDIGFNSRKNPITIQAVGSDSIRTTSLVSSFTLSADGGAVVLINTATREWWQM